MPENCKINYKLDPISPAWSLPVKIEKMTDKLRAAIHEVARDEHPDIVDMALERLAQERNLIPPDPACDPIDPAGAIRKEAFAGLRKCFVLGVSPTRLGHDLAEYAEWLKVAGRELEQ